MLPPDLPLRPGAPWILAVETTMQSHRCPEQRVIHLHHLKGGDRGQVEEEEVQTAAGLTPGGQRSWETAGQYEDERSMSRLDKPEPHVSRSEAADGVMRSRGERVKGSKLKATKSNKGGEGPVKPEGVRVELQAQKCCRV